MVGTLIGFHGSLPSKTNWVDIWGDSIQNFCVEFSLYSGLSPQTTSNTFCIDNQTQQIELIGTNNDTCFITMTSVSNEQNGKSHILLDIYSRVTEKLAIRVKGNSGTINMWQGYILGASGYYSAFYKDFYFWATNGDDDMSSSDIASTNSAIAVGAYTSKSTFTNISGSTLSFGQSLNNITTFSSQGPTADGRTKPNIAGPGSVLASAVNSYDADFTSSGSNYNLVSNQYISPLNSNTYSYAFLQGTSMSSPATAGIIALMLQANPSLDPYQVQNILYSTAIIDSYTGTIPATGDNTWGWGKINAYAAVGAALTFTGIYHEDRPTLTGLLYPNPSAGKYTIELNAEQAENIKLNLVDINGKILQEKIWTVYEGLNNYQADLEYLAAGVYFIKLKGNKGELNVKLIKQ